MARYTYRDKPRRIERKCDGCDVVITGTSIRIFEDSLAEHYEQAHGIKRPRPQVPAK